MTKGKVGDLIDRGRSILGEVRNGRGRPVLLAAVVVLLAAGVSLLSPTKTTQSTQGARAGDQAQVQTDAAPAQDAVAAGENKAAPGSLGSTQTRSDEARAAAGAIKMSKGVTEKTIHVGLWYSDLVRGREGTEATVPGVSFPYVANNERNVMDAIVADVNARDGIAKRQVVPVYYVQNCLECPDEQVAQAMCARFTEDNKVFAISSRGNAHDSLVDCAVRTKTVYVHTHIIGQYADKGRYDEIADYFYWINGFSLERRERAYVEGLSSLNFFSPEARVGIFAQDHPIVRRGVERVLTPLLAARGITPVAQAYYSPAISDQQQYQQYVLQFQQRNVTHVLLAASNSQYFPARQFMLAAENQRYRPRYGVATDVDPRNLMINAPREQLRGAVGIGWSPKHDRGPTSEPTSPNDARCREIMRKIGESQHSDSSMAGCEGLFFLKTVLDSASELTPKGFAASVAALGDSYQPVAAMGSRFGPRQHFGAHILRHVAYNESCSCFEYVSEKYEAPEG